MDNSWRRFRKAVGLDASDDHSVYLRPLNLQPTKEDYANPILPEKSFELKDVLTTEGASVESERSPKIVEKPTRLKSTLPFLQKSKKSLQRESKKDHNAKNPKYRANYRMLAAVFRRGRCLSNKSIFGKR